MSTADLLHSAVEAAWLRERDQLLKSDRGWVAAVGPGGVLGVAATADEAAGMAIDALGTLDFELRQIEEEREYELPLCLVLAR